MKRFLLFLFALVILGAWVAPSFAAEASFSGHYRVRAFAVDNLIDGSAFDTIDATSNEERWSYVDHRFRLNIDVKQGDVMGRLQINSGNYKWGESQDLTDDEWHREMFIRFPFGPATVKVGRAWAGHPFKGIMFRGVKDALVVKYPLGPDTKLVGVLVDLDDTADKSAVGYRVIVVHRPAGSILGGAVGWYYNVVNNSQTPGSYIEDRPMWLAGTLDYTNGPVRASLTGAYKFGDKDWTTSSGTTSYDYSAYAVDARASYDFGAAGGPPFLLEAIVGYGTGDDNTGDTDLEEFTAPLPSYTNSAIFLDHGDAAEGGAQLGHSGRLQANGLGNLTWLGVRGSYKVSDRATLKGLFATYYLTEESWTVSGGGTSGYEDDRLGEEINLALVYNIMQGLDLTLSGAWFFPNDDGWTTKGSATKASDDTVSEYMAKIFWGIE